MRLDRRAFIRCAALGLPALLTRPLWAEPNRFTLAHLRHGEGWAPRPTALRRLLWEIGKRTSIEVEADAVALDPCDRRLFKLPLAYLAVDGALAYDGSPEIMAAHAHRMRELGARLIGACCGSTPAHLAEMRAVLDGHTPPLDLAAPGPAPVDPDERPRSPRRNRRSRRVSAAD